MNIVGTICPSTMDIRSTSQTDERLIRIAAAMDRASKDVAFGEFERYRNV